LGQRLPFDSLNALRAKLYADYSHFAAIGQVQPADGAAAIQALAGLGGNLGREAFVSPVKDFYLTNPIARASGVMAECSALARELKLEAAE
jgi:NADH-quinone oxidoreductase subunit G